MHAPATSFPAADRKAADLTDGAQQAARQERERKLWNFLTWAFMLAQIAVADQIFGGRAHAATEERPGGKGEGGDESGVAALEDGPDVPAFTGALPEQGAEISPEAGGSSLSAAGPAEILTFPDILSAAADEGQAVNSGAATIGVSRQNGEPGQTELQNGEVPTLILGGEAVPPLTDTVLLPGISIGAPDGSLLDLLETSIALDVDLDLALIDNILGQLGLETDLDLALELDLDALGLVQDTADIALGTVDVLLAGVASPLLHQITDSLPLTGEGELPDFAALADTVIDSTGATTATLVNMVESAGESVEPVLASLQDSAGGLISVAFETVNGAPVVSALTESETIDFGNVATAVTDTAAVTTENVLESIGPVVETVGSTVETLAEETFEPLAELAGMGGSAVLLGLSLTASPGGGSLGSASLAAEAGSGAETASGPEPSPDGEAPLLDLASSVIDIDAGVVQAGASALITGSAGNLLETAFQSAGPETQTAMAEQSASAMPDILSTDGAVTELVVALVAPDDEATNAPSTAGSLLGSLPVIGDLFGDGGEDEAMSQIIPEPDLELVHAAHNLPSLFGGGKLFGDLWS